VVTIDDMLPVSTSNSLVFSRSKKKQLFAPLIEKALAKMHGSYMTLKSGMLFDELS
jgi:calpain-15